MSQSKGASEQKPDKKGKQRVEPAAVANLVVELANVSKMTGGLWAASGSDEPIDHQLAARLSEGNVPIIQRQTLAKQVGLMQGNYHLQRLLNSHNSNGTTSHHADDGQGQSNSHILQRGVKAKEQDTLTLADSIGPICGQRGKEFCSEYGVEFTPIQQIPISLRPADYQEASVQIDKQLEPSPLREGLPEQLILNKDLQRRVNPFSNPNTPVVQRQEIGAQISNIPEEQANQINRVMAERRVEALVQEELEGFLTEFSNITITVRWVENTDTQYVERSEEVAVHPPYFMNVRAPAQAAPATLARYNTATANRRAANRATRSLLSEISRSRGRGGMGLARAKVGKSHPEDIRRILQTAFDRNLIQPGRGRERPNGEDLRNWLIQYGIGVDCSGFVSQALNRVTERIQDRPLAANEQINRGAGQLRGGARGFTQIRDTAQLQPGDTMYIPGHIRIITSVRRDDDGGIVFTTAESRAGGRADVGPDRAEWRYHNNRLQIRRSSNDRWSNSRERPTFGRQDRLQEAMEQATDRETR